MKQHKRSRGAHGFMAMVTAAALLSSVNSLEANPYLEFLRSGTYERKIEAMLHLGYAGNKKAFWLMVKNLNVDDSEGRGSERMAHLRSAAAEALGRLRDQRAVTFLVERYQKEKSLRVKNSIVFSLGLLKDRRGYGVIENGLASGETELVIQSMRAAAMTSNADFIPKIKDAMSKSGDERAALAGAYALVMMGDGIPENMNKLAAGLLSRDPVLRFWSAGYLTEAGRMEGLDPLLRAREIESTDWVRRQIDTGINRLALVKKSFLEDASLGHLKDVKIESPAEEKKTPPGGVEKKPADKK